MQGHENVLMLLSRQHVSFWLLVCRCVNELVGGRPVVGSLSLVHLLPGVSPLDDPAEEHVERGASGGAETVSQAVDDVVWLAKPRPRGQPRSEPTSAFSTPEQSQGTDDRMYPVVAVETVQQRKSPKESRNSCPRKRTQDFTINVSFKTDL